LNGGVYLARLPKDITMLEVIDAIDGTDFFERCFLGIEGCGQIEPCPFHAFWSKERTKIKQWLSETTFDKIEASVSDAWFDLRLQFA